MTEGEQNRPKTAGILGGMGPEATLELHRRILSKTNAENDQENIPMVIFNNSQIPDRSKYILDKGENPLDELVSTAKKLENSGADFIVMPCNTAHSFIDKIDESVDIPALNLIEETTSHVAKKFPDAKKIGLLITTGSKETKIYSKSLLNKNRDPILPEERFQKDVMKAIYDIKKGYKEEPKRKLENAIEHLNEKGADAVIMGCTEIPLVLSNEKSLLPLVDPVEILAEKVIEVSKCEGCYSA